MSDTTHPDAASTLDVRIGATPATNTVILERWRRGLAARAATTLPIVASVLLETPGTEFVPEPAPAIGSTYKGAMVTKALLFPTQQGHVAYLMKASDQLKALHTLVLSSLGHDVKAMLENNTVYIDNKLHIASDCKIHLLLGAIQMVCSTREGSTTEESLASLQEDMINVTMGNLSFSQYMELVKAQCNAVRATGGTVSEAQEVVYAIRGLGGDFLPIKEALLRAAAIAGTGLPTTRAAFRAAVVRIEATMGTHGSAFAARVDGRPKLPSKAEKEDRGEEKTYRGAEKTIFDAGYKKGAKRGDARVKTAEDELAVSKLKIAELEASLAKATGGANKAREAAKAEEPTGRQRSLPAGALGKNIPPNERRAVDKGYASLSERKAYAAGLERQAERRAFAAGVEDLWSDDSDHDDFDYK